MNEIVDSFFYLKIKFKCNTFNNNINDLNLHLLDTYIYLRVDSNSTKIS